MRNSFEIDDLENEGIVLSTPSFIITRESILLRGNTKLRLSDVAFVGVRDNRKKVNAIRWVAIILISTAIFAYDLLRQGHVDQPDLFVVPLVVASITYLVTLNFRKIKLIVNTTSGHEHVLAEVDGEDISLENVHNWCGIISATGVDWKTE